MICNISKILKVVKMHYCDRPVVKGDLDWTILVVYTVQL